MKLRPLVGLTAMLVGMTAMAVPQPALAKTVSFAGYTWGVKSAADLLGPGPTSSPTAPRTSGWTPPASCTCASPTATDAGKAPR